MTLQMVFADLHVHLGGIKMAAALDLNVGNILYESAARKGIQMVGIIDAAAPPAQAQLGDLVAAGELQDLPDGGLRYRDATTLILGCEVEVYHGGPLHLLCYFPGRRELAEFGQWQQMVVKNPRLSTQRHRATAAEVVERMAELAGFVVPAHCFTPYKSILAAAGAVEPVIPRELWQHVPAAELGLSSDTRLADQIPELQHFTYVTNSDAHSLPKIAREYNELRVAAPTFAELRLALAGAEGRAVVANYGLDPRLGKYHRSFCLVCDTALPGEAPVTQCPRNPAHRLELGVLDRIHGLSAAAGGPPERGRIRPPYVHQVPLQFIPGLGKKALDKLLAAFGSEMQVLHRAGAEELAAVVGPALAQRIAAARGGELAVTAGAGGTYGKIALES